MVVVMMFRGRASGAGGFRVLSGGLAFTAPGEASVRGRAAHLSRPHPCLAQTQNGLLVLMDSRPHRSQPHEIYKGPRRAA